MPPLASDPSALTAVRLEGIITLFIMVYGGIDWGTLPNGIDGEKIIVMGSRCNVATVNEI